jgi:hypothetical protein
MKIKLLISQRMCTLQKILLQNTVQSSKMQLNLSSLDKGKIGRMVQEQWSVQKSEKKKAKQNLSRWAESSLDPSWLQT